LNRESFPGATRGPPTSPSLGRWVWVPGLQIHREELLSKFPSLSAQWFYDTLISLTGRKKMGIEATNPTRKIGFYHGLYAFIDGFIVIYSSIYVWQVVYTAIHSLQRGDLTGTSSSTLK
jgi:hypothetical protein